MRPLTGAFIICTEFGDPALSADYCAMWLTEGIAKAMNYSTWLLLPAAMPLSGVTIKLGLANVFSVA